MNQNDLDLHANYIHRYIGYCEVLTRNIKSRKMVNGSLGVVYILVYDESGPTSVFAFLSETDLIHGTVFTKYPVQLFGRHGKWEIANV